MSFNNDNVVAVITGLSKDIGKAIAEDFIKSGYNVLINSSDKQELKIVTEEILNSTGNKSKVSYFAGDISNQNFSEALIDEAIKKFGRIDVLINYEKITKDEKKIDITEINSEIDLQKPAYFILEEYENMDPKIKGIYYCIKAAVKRMLTGNGKNYSIVNISSCKACMTQKEVNTYTESKFGIDPYVDSMANIETLTKTIALELADKGIRVNGIVPGVVSNEMNEEIIKDPQKKAIEEKEIPLKRFAKPQEISKVALFLASEDASYITGAMIPVDGGLTLSRPTYFVEVTE